jgi:glycosyltransferase involved in cell wall biosynthesis
MSPPTVRVGRAFEASTLMRPGDKLFIVPPHLPKWMTTVSVVLPTYNRSEYLPGAIETALRQTYDDIEVVVVDDGSTDDTQAVLKEYRHDERVKTLRNETNRGISYSRNRGTDAADGEYICVLDDDDRWHHEKVRKQVSVMDELSPEYGIVYTGGIVVNDGQIVQRFDPERRGDVYPDILARWRMNPHSGHMVRKRCLEAVGGYDTDMTSGVDWELDLRLAKQYKYEYIDEYLVKKVEHDGNISSREEHTEIRSIIGQKYEDELSQHPAIARAFRAREHEVKGWAAVKRGRHLEAVRRYAAAFRAQPSTGRAFYLTLAILGPWAFDLGGTVRRALFDRKAARTIDRSYIEEPFA